MMMRKPAALSSIREPRRTLELACFIRLQLMRLTDTALVLVDHLIAFHWREAKEGAIDNQRGRLTRFRGLLGDLTQLADDQALDADALRAKLRSLIAPFEPELGNTQILAIRRELAERSSESEPESSIFKTRAKRFIVFSVRFMTERSPRSGGVHRIK